MEPLSTVFEWQRRRVAAIPVPHLAARRPEPVRVGYSLPNGVCLDCQQRITPNLSRKRLICHDCKVARQRRISPNGGWW